MNASQCQLNISRTRLTSVQPFAHGVRVVSENGTRDYSGCFAFPGFVDSHAHVIGLGMKLGGLSLYDCKSAEECVQRARNYPKRRGEWIVGMGWNHELWSQTSLPSRQTLDEHFPNTPVYLRRSDGHAAWLNSEALRRSNIDVNTIEPLGGSIQRDDRGKPTGILVDLAMDLASIHIPDYTNDQYVDFIRASLKECSSKGLTEIHDMDVAPRFISRYRQMAEQGELSCRIQSWVSAQNHEYRDHGVLPAVGEFQQTIGVKFYADGALGSHGAALLEAYNDDPTSHGLFLLEEDKFYEESCRAISQGFHIATHAIGDAANRLVLRAYAKLRAQKVAGADTLLRVEHAQIVHPNDLALFAANDIIASVQPVHCTSDAPMARKRLADRCAYAYPWRRLLQSGARICGGSDFPIESHDPLSGIEAFCRRMPFNESEAWFPEERLQRHEAILAYTEWAHVAADTSYRRGRLEPGQDADFVILDKDIAHCDDNELLQTKVIATYCAGNLKYEG